MLVLKAIYSCSERSAVLATKRFMQEMMEKSFSCCFQCVWWLMLAYAWMRVVARTCIILTFHIGLASKYFSRVCSGYELDWLTPTFCSLRLWLNLWAYIFLNVSLYSKKLLLCTAICFPLWGYGLFWSPAMRASSEFQVHSKMVQVISLLAWLRRVHEQLCCPVEDVITCVRAVLDSRAGSLFNWHSCSEKGMNVPSANELNWTGKIELDRKSVV